MWSEVWMKKTLVDNGARARIASGTYRKDVEKHMHRPFFRAVRGSCRHLTRHDRPQSQSLAYLWFMSKTDILNSTEKSPTCSHDSCGSGSDKAQLFSGNMIGLAKFIQICILLCLSLVMIICCEEDRKPPFGSRSRDLSVSMVGRLEKACVSFARRVASIVRGGLTS